MLEDKRTVTLSYIEYENMVNSIEEKDKAIEDLMEKLNRSDKKVVIIYPMRGGIVVKENGKENTKSYFKSYIDSVRQESSDDFEDIFGKFREIIRCRLETGSVLTRVFANRIINILYDRRK